MTEKAIHPSMQRIYDKTGLNANSLADAINEASQTVYNWDKRGISKQGALKVSDKFNLDTKWILSGQGSIQSLFQSQSLSNMVQGQIQHMNFVPPVDLTHNDKPRQTPVLSWVQGGDFTYVLSADLSNAIDWIPYDARAGQYGFALIVKGVSMEPEFKPDEYIYINPTYQIDELNTGALVVMACDGDGEATFKELVAEDGNYYLRPLNPNWKPQIIPVDHTCRLVGKVVGKYRRY